MLASRIVELWRKWRSAIDERVSELVSGLDEARAVEAARYITMGGKRLRGFLTVLVAEELGGRGDDAIDAAAAVELVHAASLALDDIIDADTVRRGKPAAWLTFGVGRTVMVSNLLIPLAQRLVEARYGCNALKLTVRAWLSMSRGEVLDVFYDAEELPLEAYQQIARLKTGALFRLAAELGAVAAGREDLVPALGEFGERLGYAYQVADDTVDLVREARGERVAPTTGYTLFRRLVGGNVDRALNLLREAVGSAEEAARPTGSKLLRELPRFMASAMLAEVGLSLA